LPAADEWMVTSRALANQSCGLTIRVLAAELASDD
jgi:hypothetical protein